MGPNTRVPSPDHAQRPHRTHPPLQVPRRGRAAAHQRRGAGLDRGDVGQPAAEQQQRVSAAAKSGSRPLDGWAGMRALRDALQGARAQRGLLLPCCSPLPLSSPTTSTDTLPSPFPPRPSTPQRAARDCALPRVHHPPEPGARQAAPRDTGRPHRRRRGKVSPARPRLRRCLVHGALPRAGPARAAPAKRARRAARVLFAAATRSPPFRCSRANPLHSFTHHRQLQRQLHHLTTAHPPTPPPGRSSRW